MAKTILLVDDEEGIRKVLGIALRDAGYEVLTAENGLAGLRIFKEAGPQIILTDIKMPGLDGLSFLREVKKNSPDTEVIMITGHGDMDLAVKSLKYEATDFITKPINDEALEVALSRAQEKIFLKRQLKEYTERLEQLVEEKTRKLLEAERLAAIGQTIAGLSHAIKNIASGLEGGIFVLEKGLELDETAYRRQGWDMVRIHVEKIKNLSLDLLGLAKPAIMNFQQDDPNNPARQVGDLMKNKAADLDVVFSVTLAEDPPECLLDIEAVHRALLNLVTNALEACADWKGEVRSVSLRVTIEDGRWVVYTVADTGPGMTPEVMAGLFSNFFTTKGSRGTGLGLLITRKIVEGHGGVIRVDSSPGAGAIFVIKLPMNRPID
ncbi:MAG: response regulator [Deltaproteobacteria bacterium]|nr:response regulator [Deltaproteobacteria bacterium]